MIKKLKRMFGISAPRMAVRAAIPWYLRWLGLFVLALFIVFLSRLAYDFGKQFAGFEQSEVDREVQRLRARNAALQQELARLQAQFALSERQFHMERATYGDLVEQVKALTQENTTLKEDLAFFQTLMSSSGKDDGIAINRFVVQNGALPGEYRYRLLLTQTGKRGEDFQGSLQFAVYLQQDGRKMVMTLPAKDKNEKGFELKFRFYQRIEGTFRVAPNAKVNSMQVQVFEDGASEPKLTQTTHAS